MPSPRATDPENDFFYDQDAIRGWLSRNAAGENPLIAASRPVDDDDDAEDAAAVVVVDNFLPLDAAVFLRNRLERAPTEDWDLAETSYDDDADAEEEVDHTFDASTSIDAVNLFTRVGFALQALAGENWSALYPSFTAGRYSFGHKIDPHDDCAVVPVELADEGVEWQERRYAMAYYLTPDDWSVEVDGGAFEDLNDVERGGRGRIIEPKFNRLVIFKVPRVHAVREVTSRMKKRHSIFGWWYAPMMPNDKSDEEVEEEEEEERAAVQSSSKRRKKT